MRSKRRRKRRKRRKRRRKTRRQRRRGGQGTRNPRAQTRRDDHRLEVPWDEKDYTAKTPTPRKRKSLKKGKSRGNLTALMRRDGDKFLIMERARKLSVENKNRPGILREELTRKEYHAQVQKAVKEFTIKEFEKMILKKPSIKLDEAILIFEKAPKGQTLEEFAEVRMRTAKGYRNKNREFFNAAKRRTEKIWAPGAANIPIKLGLLARRRGMNNDNRVALGLHPRSRRNKDLSNLAYFNTGRKARKGGRTRRRRRSRHRRR